MPSPPSPKKNILNLASLYGRVGFFRALQINAKNSTSARSAPNQRATSGTPAFSCALPKTLLSALVQCAPDILQACLLAIQAADRDASFVRSQAQAFEACRSESIEHAVTGHYANVAWPCCRLPVLVAMSAAGRCGRPHPLRRPGQPPARARPCVALIASEA